MEYKLPRKPSRPFKVGDSVQVMNGDHSICGGPYRVKKVTKFFATLPDGRKFKQVNGWWQGESRAWPFPWLRHTKAK